MDYIQEANLIIIPVLAAIGFAMKQSKLINYKYIPIILLALGATLGALNGGIIRSVLEGIICAGLVMGVGFTGTLIKK